MFYSTGWGQQMIRVDIALYVGTPEVCFSGFYVCLFLIKHVVSLFVQETK